ncbi:M48 metallopeptidase family protein [Streptomyces montanisoli]|uniref:M48 family metallopeptidase n=1 Tax=Streptomyces montanisoli TaxID=2798581 RepID=A0A940MGM2_9ACTN|nr:M48 family metallopeptidase [Streptomyces montanisoli]MBP0459941.1 M48 family metallopeptidase [Streptomyces montanisoli]
MPADRPAQPGRAPRGASAARAAAKAATATGTSATGTSASGTSATGAAPADAVEVRRSTRRRRTVSAYREGDRTIVLIPARMTKAEERRWVTVMLDKLAAQESRRTFGDDELAARAERLSGQYFGGKARPAVVRWVTNQNTRWGSCTPAEASIRLSHRLQGMPEYVVDYVLLHELAHLLVPGHGPDFWRLLDAYPRTERARGYLEGVVAAERLPVPPAPDEEAAADAE